MKFLFFLLFITTTTQAYIDPGTGSQLLQVLIASSVGIIFAIKTYWSKIKIFFHKHFSK